MNLISGQLETPELHFQMEEMEFRKAYSDDMATLGYPDKESLLEAFDVISFTILKPFKTNSETLLRLFNTLSAFKHPDGKYNQRFHKYHTLWVAKKRSKYPNGPHLVATNISAKLDKMLVEANM